MCVQVNILGFSKRIDDLLRWRLFSIFALKPSAVTLRLLDSSEDFLPLLSNHTGTKNWPWIQQSVVDCSLVWLNFWTCGRCWIRAEDQLQSAGFWYITTSITIPTWLRKPDEPDLSRRWASQFSSLWSTCPQTLHLGLTWPADQSQPPLVPDLLDQDAAEPFKLLDVSATQRI